MVTEGEQLDQSLLLPLICLLQLLLLLFRLLLLPYCLLQCVQESRAIDPKLRRTNLDTSRETPAQASSVKKVHSQVPTLVAVLQDSPDPQCHGLIQFMQN